jgi:hypothetical protein
MSFFSKKRQATLISNFYFLVKMNILSVHITNNLIMFDMIKMSIRVI